MKVMVRKKIDCEQVLGTFIKRADYTDILINEDCDLYAEALDGETSEANIIFKFRKNVFSKEECDNAYAGLRDAAVESQNRGIAAGPRAEKLKGRDWVTEYNHDILDYLIRPDNALIEDESIESIRNRYKNYAKKDDTRGKVWLRSEILKKYDQYEGWFDKWVDSLHNYPKDEVRKQVQYVVDNFISDTNYATAVMSGIAGYFDRYPRIPYGRATAYTEKNPEKFALSFPYLEKLNAQFKELLPNRWNNQKRVADKLDPRFLIGKTVFTTLTVNHNWRTACHRDAGDLHEGFSNICGITGPEGKGWRGAEFILPEYKVAINLQPGDMLLVNNHAGIHGNDELIGEDNDRLTIVAYFREKMLELKSWEYESLRKQYVEERRLNPDHPLQRKLWNGISPGMWEEQDWYDYLKKHNIENPYFTKNKSSIEGFFND